MMDDKVGLSGHGTLYILNPDFSIASQTNFENQLTDIGLQYYARRGAAIAGAPAAATGMKLGTGTTATSLTGAGAALVTYLANSHQAFDSTFPVASAQSPKQRVTYQSTYPAGKATSASTQITEVVIVNTTLADSTSAASATISRALISPGQTKAADQIAVIVWNHDFSAI